MATAFSQFGIEIETMIVDRRNLDLRPVSDGILRDGNGKIVNSIRQGPITWSNELVMHVLEFKTSVPVKKLAGLDGLFHQSMLLADDLLEKSGCGLLGTSMHPWFHPHAGVTLWPYDDCEIYDAFDRIFDCRGHGWSNLQSFHLNLPFEVGDEDSFRRLHSAIRLVLPLIPALAASSPYCEGLPTGVLDTRLEKYQKNCARIPSITGGVIPDVYKSQAEYQERVFDVIARDVEPFDSEGILEPEWTNARGAIARFDRGSIEIRVGDVQECPRRDLAIIEMVVHLVQTWYEEKHVSLRAQEAVSTETLKALFAQGVASGRQTRVEDEALQKAYGLKSPQTVGRALQGLLPDDTSWSGDILAIIRDGNLAERILKVSADGNDPGRLNTIYRQLRACLLENVVFG